MSSAPQVMYHSLRRWLAAYAAAGHIAADFVDMTSLDAIARRGAAGADQARLGRDPGQPAVVDHRHRRRRRDRASRPARCSRSTAPRRRPVLTRPLGARRRHRHAFGDEIPERPQRRDRRLADRRARRRILAAPRRGAQQRRRDPRRPRGLSAAARHAHAATCGSSAPAARRSGSPSALAANPQVAAVLYPGLPEPSRPRRRGAADAGRLRRHAERSASRAARRRRSPRRRGSRSGSARPRSAASRA